MTTDLKTRRSEILAMLNLSMNVITIVGGILYWIFVAGKQVKATEDNNKYIEEKVKPFIEKKYETDTKFFYEQYDRAIQPVVNEINEVKKQMDRNNDDNNRKLDLIIRLIEKK